MPPFSVSSTISITIIPSFLFPFTSCFSLFLISTSIYFFNLVSLSCTIFSFYFPLTLHIIISPLLWALAPSPLRLLFLLPSLVDFSLMVAVIRPEMDGLVLQSFPSSLLLMDLPARPLESSTSCLVLATPQWRADETAGWEEGHICLNVFLKAQMYS